MSADLPTPPLPDMIATTDATDAKAVIFHESAGVPHSTYSDANLLKVYLENIRARIEKDGHKLDPLKS